MGEAVLVDGIIRKSDTFVCHSTLKKIKYVCVKHLHYGCRQRVGLGDGVVIGQDAGGVCF